MGRIFLPSETRGIWDGPQRTLTVFVGEEVFVGYDAQGGDARKARFSASQGGSGEYVREVYSDGPGRLQAKVETPMPLRLDFTVEDGDGKELAKPIRILVRTRPSWEQIPPVGQLDSNACWAASIQWWLRAAPDRGPLDQKQLLVRTTGMLGADGTIDPARLTAFVSANPFRMTGRSIAARSLPDFFGMWPLLLGFRAPGGFGHMNVLWGRDPKTRQVRAMEPWSPDPAGLGAQLDTIDDGRGPPVYFYKGSGDPYRFLGAHVSRPETYYTEAALKNGQFWVGVPSEYLARP